MKAVPLNNIDKKLKENQLLSWWSQFLIFLSPIVIVEPAPTDLLVITSFVVKIGAGSKKFLVPILPTLFLSIFALSNLASSFVAEDFRKCIFVLVVRSYLIVSWFVFVDIFRRSDTLSLNKSLSIYAITAMASSIVGILGILGIIPLEVLTYDSIRPKAFFKDPNVFGPFLIPAALFSSTKIFKQNEQPSWFYLSSLFLTSLGVLLSFSRGAWINYAVTFSIYVLLQMATCSYKKISLRRMSAYLLISILTLMLTYVFLQANSSFLDLINARTSLQSYDSDRFEYQRIALEKSLTSLVGVGPGQMEVSVTSHSTHSLYLRILGETSWTGVLGFFGFVMLSLYHSLRGAFLKENDVRHIHAIAFASILGILINSLVIDTLHWRHFWLLLSLAWIFPISKKICHSNQ